MAEAAVVVVKMNKYLIISIILISALILSGFFIKSSFTGKVIDTQNLSSLTLKVSIPCGGHASLIERELNKLEGIAKIEYTPITTFRIYYDPTKISEKDILNLSVFKDYPAKKIN